MAKWPKNALKDNQPISNQWTAIQNQTENSQDTLN